MSRPNKIWFRKDIGWWMVTIGGSKIRLTAGKANRKVAEQKFHELKAVQAKPTESSDARVADIIDAFLAWTKIHRSPTTNRNYISYGQKFSEASGYLKATEVRPVHVTRWVDSHKWNQTTERNARRSIFRAFVWAVEEGLLSSNPLSGMRSPGALTRQRAMTDEEFRILLRSSTREFKIVLFSLRVTGCRPSELRSLTWDEVSDDRWTLKQHKTFHKTHRARVVYLIKPMQILMKVLRREAGEEARRDQHVFLNARHKKWTENSVRLRIHRLKQKHKLRDDVCCYQLRHSFGTSAILAGVDALAVAELMGHSSLEMIKKVYVHLSGEHQFLHAAAERATKLLAVSKPRPGVPNQVG
jgi:integrase